VALCLALPYQAHARLPRPIHLAGTILAVDVQSKTLRFQATNGKKPLLLDWNKETDFSDGAKAIQADQIACPASATIDYRDLTFRHPLLKKVAVAAGPPSPSPEKL
jgi:hypothetical protein